MRTRSNGFTLLEMMVVVGIIAMLALATIPLFSMLTAGAEADSAALSVTNAIQEARSLAMNTHRVVTVEFANVPDANTGMTIGVIYLDMAEDDRPAPADVTLFSSLAVFKASGSNFLSEPYILEGMEYDPTLGGTKPIANGGWGAVTEGDGTVDGNGWPDIAIGPEGYILDDTTQERYIGFKTSGGTIGDKDTVQVRLEVHKFGTVYVKRVGGQ
jgi:prepilin-type N-terminal cleavage/methylation domain-containing protein